MKIVRNAIKATLSSAGYDVFPKSEQRVKFSNFLSLTQAYEQRLIERGSPIEHNDVRPTLISQLIGASPSEVYFIVDALNRCKEIKGAVCEFGVAQGATSAVIANEIRAGEKILHLFDSFEGLPKPTEQDQLKDDIFSLGSMEAYTGAMSCPEDMVQSRLSAISFPANRYVIHKGFVNQVLIENVNLPEKVSFAYVDFDFYEPIKETLNYLHTILADNAIIIVDDYNFFSTGAKTATDEFVMAQNEKDVVYECTIPDSIYGYFAILKKIN